MYNHIFKLGPFPAQIEVRQRMDWEQPCEGGLEAVGDEKLTMTQQGALAAQKIKYPELHQKNVSSRSGEAILPF